MSAKQGLQYFFDLYDVDKDGFLSLEELRTFLGDNKFDCQTGSENAEQTMDENDVDRDGKLDFEDFSFLLFHEKGYVELFYDCDQNHDGFIDEKELQEGMVKLGEEYEDDIIQEIIIEHDKDKDGKLNYLEFKNMLKSL